MFLQLSIFQCFFFFFFSYSYCKNNTRLTTENVKSIKMYKLEKKKNLRTIRSARGNHYYKLCGISNLCCCVVLTYMRNDYIYNFAEDMFLWNCWRERKWSPPVHWLHRVEAGMPMGEKDKGGFYVINLKWRLKSLLGAKQGN